MQRPRSVQLAILQDDRSTLSFMGKRGGQISAQRREARKRLEELEKERQYWEFLALERQAHEDICPID